LAYQTQIIFNTYPPRLPEFVKAKKKTLVEPYIPQYLQDFYDPDNLNGFIKNLCESVKNSF